MACHRHLFDHRLLGLFHESGKKSISSPTTLSSSSATFPRTSGEECQRKNPRRLLLSLNPLIYVRAAHGSQSMAGLFLAVSLLLLSSSTILQVHGKFEDCDKSLIPGAGSDMSLSCKLRTLNSEFDKTNISALSGNAGDSNSIVSLMLECSSILFYQSNLQPGSLSHLSTRLQSVLIENCKFTRLSPGVFSGLSQLRNLTIRTHNTKWPALSLDLAAGVFNELTHLEQIDISSNNIWTLPDRLFCDMTSLQYINISTNRLQDVSDLRFREGGCHLDLKKLDISKNRLIVLPSGGLSSVSQLEELYVQSNEISMVQDYAFAELTKLRIVNASDNKISSLPESLFPQSVTEIYLRNNSLSELSTLFFGLEHLIVLDLAFNSITNISGNFNRLIRLVSLDMSHNQLTRLDGEFTDLYSLQYANFEFNEIEEISQFAFSSMRNLHTLILSHNKLTKLDPLHGLLVLNLLSLDFNTIDYIHPDAFKNCSSLKDLNLNANALDHIPVAVQNLTLLKTVDFGENMIERLENLVGLRNLYGLRLTGNRLENVTRGSLDELQSLRVINLARNRLQSVENGAFDANTNLQAIRLDANFLTQLPNLSSLPSLIWLNVSDNMLGSEPDDEGFDFSLIPKNTLWIDIHANFIHNMLNFDKQMNVQTLDLSFNRLEKVSNIPDSVEMLFLHNNKINYIEPGVFYHLANLSRVELFQNDIQFLELNSLKVSPAFADGSKELPEFYIAGNPIECDCQSEWLARMNQLSALRQYPRIADIDAILCRFHDKIIPLEEAKPGDFLCQYRTHCFATCSCCGFTCDCEQHCPDNCTCLHDVTWGTTNRVECSNSDFLKIPARIPMDVTELYLDGNDFKDGLTSHVFIGKKNLRSLYLNNSKIAQIQNNSLSGLKNVELLRLEDNLISRLEGYEFEPLESLRQLYLDRNRITYIEEKTFANLRLLEVLSIQGNRISSFSMWTLNMNPYLVEIAMSGNPFSCNCEFLLKAVPFINAIKHKLVDAPGVNCRLNGRSFSLLYINATTCSEITALSGVSELDPNETKLPPYLPLLAAVMAICLLIGIVFLSVCRRRDSLKIWSVAKCPLNQCYQTTLDDDKEKLYDAYIMYSLKDDIFATDLQQQFCHHRLCLHYKDLPVSAAYIADTIVEAVESSRKIIIILSKNLVNNELSRFEYKSALHAALRGKRNRLIVIVLGEVGTLDDPDLRVCLQNATVLNAPSKKPDKRFWAKLVSSLPQPRISARTPISGSICSSSSVHASTLPFISSDSSASSNHFHNLPPPLPPSVHHNSMTMSHHYHHHHPPPHFYNSNTLGSNGFPTSHLNGNVSAGNGTISHHHSNGVNNNIAANNSDHSNSNGNGNIPVAMPYVPPFPPPNRPPPPFPAPRRPPPPPLWT